MLTYKTDYFTMEAAKPVVSVEQLNGEYFAVKNVLDSHEKKNKLFYQVIELLLYLGWPAIVAGIVFNFSNSSVVSVSTFFMLLFWPVLKGQYGRLKARVMRIKDSRHAIKSTSFWFDGFLGVGSSLLREVRKYSSLSRSLDCIYNLRCRFGVLPKYFSANWWQEETRLSFLNIIIKRWTHFWYGMPIACDVRTRLQLVVNELKRMVVSVYNTGQSKKVKILVLAGGTNQDILLTASELKNELPEVELEVTNVEPDGLFAVHRIKDLAGEYGLPDDFITTIPKRVLVESDSRATLKEVVEDYGYQFDEYDIILCIGLGDYMYGEDKLISFLKMIDNGKRIITANISDNYVERFVLHKFMQWPKMQYLSLKKYKNYLVRAFGVKRQITLYRTPNKIFNIAVVE